MSTSEQLERETEEQRARISETLDELRSRMTPGHVVDRLVDYANESSGGMFFRNLRQQAVDNPMPVTLLGAGLAWLALSGRRRETQGAEAKRGQAKGSTLQDSAGVTADKVADTASSTFAADSEAASGSASRMHGTARSAMDSATSAASATYGAATDEARRAGEALKHSASELRSKVAGGGRSIMDFAYQQPLVLVGLGLAIGAAIGAASPSTEAEDELMGEGSDAVKREPVDRAEGDAAAERARQSAMDETEKQGLTPSQESEDTVTSQLDPMTEETPLVPSTGEQSNREAEKSRQ